MREAFIQREVQRECSNHEGTAREAFRSEGSEQKAPRLLVVCEQSPGNVVEMYRKPSDCLSIVREDHKL